MEYWEFDIPVFLGTFKTEIRYSLILLDKKIISSNQIYSNLNLDQFGSKIERGHFPDNIMDPCND